MCAGVNETAKKQTFELKLKPNEFLLQLEGIHLCERTSSRLVSKRSKQSLKETSGLDLQSLCVVTVQLHRSMHPGVLPHSACIRGR